MSLKPDKIDRRRNVRQIIKNWGDRIKKLFSKNSRANEKSVCVDEPSENESSSKKYTYENMDQQSHALENKCNFESLTAALDKITNSVNQQSQRFGSLEKKFNSMTALNEIMESINQQSQIFDSFEKKSESVNKMCESLTTVLNKITESANQQSQRFDSLEKGSELVNEMGESPMTALNKIMESINQQSQRFDSLEKKFESVNEMGESLMAALNKISESVDQQSQRFDSLEKRIELMKDNQAGEGGANQNSNQEKKVENNEITTQKAVEIHETLKDPLNHSSKPNPSTITSDTNSNLNMCQSCHSEKFDKEWCSVCDPQYFIDHFSDWTSGNQDVDSFIQATQRHASNKFNFLEWIPYTSLRDIDLIGKGGFGTIYSAIWTDGPRSKWLHETNEWGRYPNAKVALKSIELKDYKFDAILFKELQSHLAANKNVLGRVNTLRIFGMTRKPDEPENFMMVMLLGDNGDLDSYIKKNFSCLTYLKKLEILFDMITGILQIHQAGLIHRDLHRGNIMCQRFVKLEEGRDDSRFVIGDLGLSHKPSPESKTFYGVIPYCAPEVLELASYSEASDIYSFGMLMWELAAGIRAFSDRQHDESLIIGIITGLRPQNVRDIPESYEKLMKQCWAPNPVDRPSAQEIYMTIGIWLQKLIFTPTKGISQEFLVADKKRLVELPIEELPLDGRYHSKTYSTLHRSGFAPIPIENPPPVEDSVTHESDDDWVGA